MSFNNGDRVQITTKNTAYYGERGTVINVYSDNETLLVRMDKGNTSGFFASEAELVENSDEREAQISRIATALIDEGRAGDWTDETALEAARTLYTAGIRANG